MSNTNRNGLHAAKPANWEELEQKIRRHRRKRMRRIAAAACSCAAVLLLYYIAVHSRVYDDYRITDAQERSDTEATSFLEYCDGVLKYSNDGISYVNTDNDTIWMQSYEMENPIISICQEYAAAADYQGKDIYILNTEGMQKKVTVTMPIQKAEVASQGTLAVLMEDDGVNYLAMYNVEGELLAEGAIHVENGGTPLDLALSGDAQTLAVSTLDVRGGSAQTTITFYNFSSAGQKEIDNIVATYTYADTVIPDLTYVSGNRLLAFADNGVYTFSGSDDPQQADTMMVSEEIMSVFYDENYFGLVYADENQSSGRRVEIYDVKCAEVAEIETDRSYDKIRFLQNHELCMYNQESCAIYTLQGKKKFSCDFDDPLYEVVHARGYRGYVFIMEGETLSVRLKLLKPLSRTTTEDMLSTGSE